MALVAARFPIAEQRAHAVEAGAVERLKDIQRGEEERAGAASGIEDGDFADGFEEREEKVGRGIFDHALRELADVEIERDEIVDCANFACAQFALKLFAALAAGDGLAPDFRRQT